MRYDAYGFPITTPASDKRCEGCGIKFAFGHLPTDGSMICRDCRGETPQAPADPTLWETNA